jgi:hypothetical protein
MVSRSAYQTIRERAALALGPRFRHGVQQLRLPHRLHQRCIDAGTHHGPHVAPVAHGGQQNYHRIVEGRIVLDGIRHGGAVHSRHLVIQQDKVVRVAHRFGPPHAFHHPFTGSK